MVKRARRTRFTSHLTDIIEISLLLWHWHRNAFALGDCSQELSRTERGMAPSEERTWCKDRFRFEASYRGRNAVTE